MRTLVILASITLAGASVLPAQYNDGESHGDTRFLIEPGCQPLLGPTRLSGRKEPGDRIVNGTGRTSNLVTDQNEWQSYHIWFRARFLRVLFNGVSVQNDVEVATKPIMLQGDHGPVAFRNIYIRPLRPIIHR